MSNPLSIPSTIDNITQDGISDITREDYNQVASDNACLSCEVQELRQQMARLLSLNNTDKIQP